MFPRSSLSRRDFLRLSGMTVAAGALAACAPVTTTQPQGADAGAAAPSASTVTISMAGWGAGEEEASYLKGLEKFMAENPDIKVEWVHNPYQQHLDRLLTTSAAGNPPNVAWTPIELYQTFAHNGILKDITDNVKNDPIVGQPNYFIEPLEEQRATYNGRWYGVGHCWVVPHLFYNADVFAEAGITPPSNNPAEAWEWDHFVDVARQLTVDTSGRHPGDSGFDRDNVDQWGIFDNPWHINLHAAVASNGGEYIDPTTNLIALDTPQAMEAIQRIADLVLVHNVMPQGTLFEQLGMSAAQMLETGKLAMVVDGSWALSWLWKINATLGTAVLPKMTQVATNSQGPFYTIMERSSNQDAAWELTRFMVGPSFQTQMLEIGLWLPSQTALMTDEAIADWMSEEVHPEGYEMIVKDYLPNYGHVLALPPGWNQAYAEVTPAIDKIVIGDAQAQDVLPEAVAKANDILKAELERN